MSSSTTAKPINSVTKGRRTGVVMASPGKVPLDEGGMEDIDTFWNSEKVQQQEESTSNESSSIEKGGKKRENLEKKEEENEEEPNFDVGVSIQRKIGNKARYTALARRVLERQARQLDRGALSPSAQSVGTEVTELSATSMTGVSVDSPQVEVIGGTPTSTRYVKRTSDATADDMEVLSPGAASLMSPITPGEASTSVISEGNSFLQQKSKKLDTLLENDEEEINRKDDDSKPPSKESVDFGRGDGDHFDYDNDDEDGYGVEDYDDDGGGEDQVVQDEADESNVEVSIVEDEETPQKVRDQRAREERKALKTKQMKAKKKKRKTASGSGSVVSFSSPMSVHLPAGPREYDNVPVSDFNKDDDSDYENTGSRRSKRARFAPLQFWKNEKVVYGPNDNPSTFGNMPVVTTIQQALPTPMKKIHRAKPGKKILVQNLSDDDERPSEKSTKQKKFDKRKLNKQLNYVKGDTVTVWDEGSREFSEQSRYLYNYLCSVIIVLISFSCNRDCRLCF